MVVPLTVQDEGSIIATAATTLNFVGAGVTARGTGATKTITTCNGGGGGGAGTELNSLKLIMQQNGNISPYRDTSSGISSVSIDSATGGDLTINFTGYSYPPAMYGYIVWLC